MKIVTQTVTEADFYAVTRRYDHLHDLLSLQTKTIAAFGMELGSKDKFSFVIFAPTPEYKANSMADYIEVFGPNYSGDITEIRIYE